jgi:serine phosphatase RsbU (regulator of sigma subunit)
MESNAPIGLWERLEYVGEEIADIKSSPFFIYSDGLTEAENRQQEQFGEESLLRILSDGRLASCRQIIDVLRGAIEKHRDGADPNDDLTMLCLRVQ